MGKGEIALYEQFLLFPQCFQKTCFPGASKGGIVWEWVNTIPIMGYFYRRLKNIVERAENALQSICRRQILYGSTDETFLHMVEKHLEKGRKYFVKHFSPNNPLS